MRMRKPRLLNDKENVSVSSASVCYRVRSRIVAQTIFLSRWIARAAWGFCPWYSVTILNDGSVCYEGKAYVHVEGVRRKKIPVSDVNKLIQKLRDEDSLHWEEKTDLGVDYPEVRITANLNGQRKLLVERCNAPGKVLTLARELDTISEAITEVS
jgi:hypothetical protein